ncbi:MAG: EAL domain-containing protein [Rhodocyclaceae bacterium]|nr:EAL domain-containing protein [Rhodocyclaceae bacterium]MDZ4213628.1 EAL domain-containing protein [Rhodocyclaceae bacterium]
MSLSAPLRHLIFALALLLTGFGAQADAAPPEQIRVVLDDNYPPYTFRDANHQPQGLLKDLWALWEQRTGIRVDFQPMSWGKARATMENGQADVIDTIFQTPERLKIYAFSAPYASIEVALFFDHHISGITDSESARGFTIGVKEGDACIEYLNARGITDLKRYASYEAQVQAAIRQEVRVLCIDKPPAAYFFHRHGAAEQFRHTAALYVGEFHWAVAKDRADLQQVVAAGFAKITPEERRAIEVRWLGERLQASTWDRYKWPILYSLLGLTLLTSVLLAISWILRRQVANRTQALSQTLKSLRTSEDNFKTLLDEQRLIFDNAHVGILLLQNRRILKCNQHLADMFGFASPADLTGQSTEILYCSREHFEAAGWTGYGLLAQQGVAEFETEMCRQDGKRLWVIQTGRPLDPAKVLESPSIWVYTNITERKDTEEQLRVAAAAFESQESVIITDANNVILRVNRAFTETTGYAAEELIGKTPRMFKSDRHDDDFYRDMWQSIVRTGSWQGEIWDQRKNGEVYPKWLTISTVKNEKGEITHYIGTQQDISERKKAEAKIESLAFYDQLTGLANRSNLSEQLAQAVRLSARNNQPFALMLLDLDNFKGINDSLGHHVGDQLLIQVAKRLVHAVRQSDLVARLGGDEFVIILPDIESPADAAHVADKILFALAETCRLEEHELRTSTSIGICIYPTDATETHDLLQKADAAMYHAKARGRGNYQFFEEKIQEAAVQRLSIESDLRKAIHNREFVLHYQPQLDLRTGRLCGVEALLRWQHPERGLVPPLEFLPIAEESGLIEQIGDWVMVEAAQQLAEWRRMGLDEIKMSINLSAAQFSNPGLPVRISAIIEHAGLPPHSLDLEITESMTMQAPDQAVTMMRVLSRNQISLSIDDFGTGYSSMSYLKMFPINTLKIDRSFVKDIETDPHDADICDVTVLLAHRLGLDVVAEGVETEAQLKYLLSIGCEKIQGYLISKPLPAKAAGEFIRSRPRIANLGTTELWAEHAPTPPAPH